MRIEEMIIISLVVNGLSIVFEKLKIVDFYEFRRMPWMPKKWCFFCFFFWSSYCIYIFKYEVGLEIILIKYFFLSLGVAFLSVLIMDLRLLFSRI